MKSSEFIRTLVESTTAEWTATLDSAIADGQITKRNWEDTKHDINRALDKAREAVIAQNYFNRPELRDDENASNLYYAMAHDVNGLNTMKKNATKMGNDPFGQAALELYAEYAPLAAKLKELKPMIVTVTQQRAEKKEAEKQVKTSRMDSASILVDLLKEHHDEYVDRARKMGEDYHNRVMANLEKAGGIEVAAPAPNSRMSREEYRYAKAKREFFIQMLSTTAEKYGDEEAKGAHMAYMEWVYKLITKIGKPIEKANVSGNPWTGSRIAVVTNDGETQVWNTKMILNQSKYGKLFNQFPTRREN